MKQDIHVSLILPCFNEKAVFAESVQRILKTLSLSRYAYEIIFVDDGSTDGTVGDIKKITKENKHCRALFHTRNSGRGGAVADGIRMAKGTVAGYIDIDLEVSPLYIIECVRQILEGNTDVVIGRRIYRSNMHSLVREITSVGYRMLSNMVLSTHGLDTESGYKFFNRKKILPLLDLPKDTHWFWDTEITLYAYKKGLRVMEVPVLFLRRFDKKSSVRLWHDTIAYLRHLYTFRKDMASGR